MTFQLYSKSCEYTIRALTYVALQENRRCRAADICRRAKIPEAFTRKTFQALVQAGFLKAVPGPGGGYELTVEPSGITLEDVITAVDGKDTYEQCALGFKVCDDKRPCVMHDAWMETKKYLLKELRARTLADAAKSIQSSRKKKTRKRS